jgi:hypothetical protein
MNKFSKSGKNSIYLLLLFLYTTFNSCSPSIAVYDQYAYTQATSLKVDLQNLAVESSTVAFPDAKADIDRVNTEVEKGYEYANGRSKNTISTQQYEILRGENNFYKTFLKTWKSQGKLSPTGANEIKIKIGQLMDQIIELENGKNKNK